MLPPDTTLGQLGLLVRLRLPGAGIRGSKIRRQDYLQELAIVRIIVHDVFDIRRLYPSASLAHQMRSFAVELAHDPAFQDIDHLEADIVTMPDGHLIGARRD